MSKKKTFKQIAFWTTVVVAPGGGLLLIHSLLKNKSLHSKIKKGYSKVLKRVTF